MSARAMMTRFSLAMAIIALSHERVNAATGAPAALVVVSGNDQTNMPGAPLGAPLTVLVEDARGQPLEGVPVTFTVAGGGGTVSPTCVLSNYLGHAATSLTLGLEGTNTVSIVAGSAAPVTFVEIAHLHPAQHVDYYVSGLTSGASDGNDGLSATYVSGRHGPWLTIGKSAGAVMAGDIVHVANGNYKEDVSIDASGTASAPIRFYAIKGEAPRVRSFRLRSSNYIEIRGFNVVGSKVLPYNWVDMPGVVVDVPSIVIDPNVAWGSGRQALVDKKYATYMKTVNDTFDGPNYSLYTAGIWVSGSTHVTIADNTVSLHTVGIELDRGSSLLTITCNNCFHCLSGIASYSSAGASFSHSTISCNHCHQNLSTGISVVDWAFGITVANNLCEYNGILQFACSAGSASCTLRENVGRYGGYYTETMVSPGSSAYCFFNVGSGNVADGNWAAYQHDPTQKDGNGFINDTSAYPVRFVNNVAYRNGGTGITFTQTNGNTAFNNTLVGNGYQSTSSSNGAGLRFSATVAHNTIVNNIFSGNRACGVQSNGALRSQLCDYNIYAPGAPAIHDSYGQTTNVYQTVLDVRRAASQEEHGQSADPLLISVAGADFHLGQGSPGRGAASATWAPPTDHVGLPRGTPPSTGAFDPH